jgi:hypothetical protein
MLKCRCQYNVDHTIWIVTGMSEVFKSVKQIFILLQCGLAIVYRLSASLEQLKNAKDLYRIVSDEC